MNNIKLIERAFYEFNNENIKLAYKLFKTAFLKNSYENDSHYYLIASICAARIDKIEESIQFLQNYTTYNINPQRNFVILYLKNILVKDKRWHSIIKLMQAKRDKYAKIHNYNLPLRKRLERIHLKDQWIRLKYAEAESDENYPRYLLKKLYRRWLDIDKENLAEIENILRLNGKYVKKTQVGDVAYVPWIVIQHATVDIQKKYLNLLKNGAKAGDLLEANLALTIDRIKVAEGKKQIYGTQICLDEAQNRALYPVWNYKEINKRRKRIGLDDIEVTANIMHFALPQ